ncbi:hypothetical protein M758_4G126100 [Ceratodon purpureus]|nr:hypothetical protein M758_4G126100 [Ceratodon purpureus]
MATAMERAAIGAEEGRMEGKGPAGRAAEGLRNVATGRDNNLAGRTGVDPYNNNFNDGTTVGDRGLFDRNHDHHNGGLLGHHNGGMLGHNNGGMLGHTEEEMARLRLNTHVTAEGDAYCPNPNLRDLPKEFETRVQVIQRYPEMKTVEKTDFVKEIHHEERTIIVPRTRVIHDDIERIDRVPVVRQVPRTRMEVHYRVVAEEREVVDMVPEVDYMDVPRIEMVPRVITEDVEERVIVPTVREVPVTRMVEVPTGNYCEAPAGQFVTPGDFNLLHHKPAGGLLHRTKSSSSSSSSSSSDDETVDHDHSTVMPNGTVAPGGRRKKRSLLKRVLHQ